MGAGGGPDRRYAGDVPIALVEAAIPLVQPFRNAGTTVDARHVVFVGFERDGITGWGEAAPYPGISPETAADVSTAFEAGAPLPQTGAAALDQATIDWEARTQAMSLAEHLGSRVRPRTWRRSKRHRSTFAFLRRWPRGGCSSGGPTTSPRSG